MLLLFGEVDVVLVYTSAVASEPRSDSTAAATTAVLLDTWACLLVGAIASRIWVAPTVSR